MSFVGTFLLPWIMQPRWQKWHGGMFIFSRLTIRMDTSMSLSIRTLGHILGSSGKVFIMFLQSSLLAGSPVLIFIIPSLRQWLCIVDP